MYNAKKVAELQKRQGELLKTVHESLAEINKLNISQDVDEHHLCEFILLSTHHKHAFSGEGVADHTDCVSSIAIGLKQEVSLAGFLMMLVEHKPQYINPLLMAAISTARDFGIDLRAVLDEVNF